MVARIKYIMFLAWFWLVGILVHSPLVHAAEHLEINLGSGSPEGAYDSFANSLEEMFAQRNIKIINHNSNGSIANLRLLKNRRVDVALVQNDIVYNTYEGLRGYEEYQQIGAVLPLFPEYLQIVVKSNGPINTLAQLSAKRINLGKKDSGGYKNALSLLRVVGLRSIEYIASYRSTSDALKALKSGELDAVIYTSASPPAPEDKSLRLLSLPPDIISDLSAKFQYFTPAEVERGDQMVSTVSLTAYLVAGTETNAQKVSALVEGLLGKWSDLRESSRHFNLLTKKQIRLALESSPIPIHPAARDILEKRKLVQKQTNFAKIGVTVFLILVAVWWASLKYRVKYDRMGLLPVARNRLTYWIVISIEYLFISLIAIAVVVLFLVIVIYGIQHFETIYARKHALPNPFASITLPQALLWMWDLLSGHEGSMYPKSDYGRFLVGLPPVFGVGAVFLTLIIWWKRYMHRLTQLKRGVVVEPVRDHVLICGWNEKVPGIIYGLTAHDAPERKKVVVVAEIDGETPLASYNFPPHMVQYYRADSADMKVLTTTYAHKADSAIIVAGFKKRSNKNIGSVLTALALTSIKKSSGSVKPFVAAELMYEKNKPLFLECKVDALVQSGLIVERILAQSCFNEHALDFVMDLLTHDEHCEIYAMRVRDALMPPVGKVLVRNLKRRHIWYSLQGALRAMTCRKVSKLRDSRISSQDLRHALIAQGMTPVAIKRKGKRSAAFLDKRIDKEKYLLLSNDLRDEKVEHDDVLLYIAEEKDDIYRACASLSRDRDVPKGGVRVEWEFPQDSIRKILLIGDLNRCSSVARQVVQRGNVNCHAAILSGIADESGEPNDLFESLVTVDHIRDNRIVDFCLELSPDVVVVLLDRAHEAQSLSSNVQQATELDAETLVIANALRTRSDDLDRRMRIIGEMLSYGNRDLFAGAGIDVIVPSNILLERFMVKMAYGYGFVGDFLIASMTLDDNVFLDSYSIGEMDNQFLGKSFRDLLYILPDRCQLLGIYPANPKIQNALGNRIGDFGRHYLGAPAHADKIGYISEVGDNLILLRREEPSGCPASPC